MQNDTNILNAFCVDLEEWFHICGVATGFEDLSTWNQAISRVEQNTEVLMELLEQANAKGTFLTVGWIAERYPQLIKKLSDAGHEIGCHSYAHQLVYTLTPKQFEVDLECCLGILRDISGQPVNIYRAPGFSMTRNTFWAYPILAKHGVETDISLVPANRDHGGLKGFTREPFILKTNNGNINIFPVSVMNIFGKLIPFSGGGYLRLLLLSLIYHGFSQNHKMGRPCMTYIHPREIDKGQPRLKLPLQKYFKYYFGINSTQEKLRSLLKKYKFGTISQTMEQMEKLPIRSQKEVMAEIDN
ncbi:MAG: polysaccharide deacetylase family protein [Pseudomonadota bacterium]